MMRAITSVRLGPIESENQAALTSLCVVVEVKAKHKFYAKSINIQNQGV